MDLCFVDIETTGLDPARHEVIEVAAIRVDAKTLDYVMSAGARIAPKNIESADPEALKVNGYSDSWRGLITSNALNLIAPMLDGAILAGHNAARFDVPFLEAAYSAAGIQINRSKYVLDTAALLMPRFIRGEISSVSLEFACAHFGISNPRAHSAMSDAMASLELARILLRE